MKRVIIAVLVVVGAGAGIAYILDKNKNENLAKTEVVAKASSSNAVVTIATVEKSPLVADFTVNGNFVANQDLKLLSEASGRVTQILVDEGARVSKGQILARIDAEYASLDVQRIEDALAKLKTDYARYSSSYETGGVTKAQLDEVELALRNTENQLQQAKRRLSDAEVKAPIAGVINKRMIEMGAFVGPGAELFEIVDVSKLKLKVSVNEAQVVQLKKGDKVTIKSTVFPESEYSGVVSFIAVKADNSLNYPIEIEVANSGKNELKAGMYGTAYFNFPQQEDVIQIPRSSFVGSVNSNQVYVMSADSVATLRQVTPGKIFGDKVVILQGLEEGETVITTGQINLNDGDKVNVLNKN